MPQFDPSVLAPNPVERGPILQILQAALDAVDPFAAVANHLHREGDTLHIQDQRYHLPDYDSIYVVGAGKAGAPMAHAVAQVLHDRITEGLVVVKTGHADFTAPPAHKGSAPIASPIASPIAVVEASHPIPDAAGAAAGRKILEIAGKAGPNDLIIALLSGGGSALLVAPAEGITLEDMQQMTDALLASGATINEVNCLRKHCDALKGGQLARAAHPATLITLALSDVIGSPLDVIASGPTVPDETTWADAWQIVERFSLQDKLPAAVFQRLQKGLHGELDDTPKPGDPAFDQTQTVVVADNRIAALAAHKKAQELGFNAMLLTTYLEGEAAQVGKMVAALGKEIQTFGAPLAPPACLILGGETTVTLGSSPGTGGRNQELAVAAGVALQHWPGITVVALATDGTDGPTDSAGGIGDSQTRKRGQAGGLDAESALRRHDAYPFLQKTQDLLRTGPTQTNVNDLVFVFVFGE